MSSYRTIIHEVALRRRGLGLVTDANRRSVYNDTAFGGFGRRTSPD